MAFMPDHSAFRAHQAAVRTILGLVGRFQLTVDGPTVEVAHSDLNTALPPCSVRVSAGRDELLVRSSEWVGRDGELEARVGAWLVGRVGLRGTKLRKARRTDPVWKRGGERTQDRWVRAGGGAWRSVLEPRNASCILSYMMPWTVRPASSAGRPSGRRTGQLHRRGCW